MKRSLITFGVILLVAVMGLIVWRTWPMSRVYYTDADTIKTPTQSAVLREILWQPPQLLPSVINTSDEDYEPRISSDGLTLLFVRRKAGHNADIFFARKTPEGWTEPAPLGGVNSESDDLGPVLAHDGRAIYFYSNRTGSIGGYDLWVARRRADTSFEFEEAINLGPGVNSPFNEYGPSLTADGDILYFSSNRPLPEDKRQPNPNAWQATLREDLFHRTYDLYVAVITDRGVGSARPLVQLNTPFNEGAPAVSPVGDFLYFASDRPDGSGGFDLYRSRRLHGEHEPAETLGATVNSDANDLDPSLGMGGYGLYFSSDRRQVEKSNPRDAPAEYNLYHTTSREVFIDAETLARPPIDWAAIFSALWPNLLWLLIALSLLLLLWAIMRRVEEQRVGLLTRCLLASMLVHLVLVLLLTIWGVSATLAGELRRGGKIQIALAPPASGNEIAMQITGALTSVDSPMAETPPVERADAPAVTTVEAQEARLDVRSEAIPIDTATAVEMVIADASAEWRRELARDTKPPVMQPEPMALSLSTPVESSRISHAEVVEAVRPSERPMDQPRRPDVDTMAQRVASRSVDMMPTTTNQLFDNPDVLRSLADEITTGDAVPARTRDTIDAEVAIPAELPPAPGIQLAMATPDRLPEVQEAQLDPADRQAVVPRLRVEDYAPTRFEHATASRLAPADQALAAGIPDEFTDQQLAQAADAIPRVDASPAEAEPVGISLPDNAQVDVATPAESNRIAEAEETKRQRAPTKRPAALRPTDMSFETQARAHRVDEINPESSERVVDEPSLATIPQAIALDSATPAVQLAVPANRHVDSALPDQTVFELPRLEESVAPQIAEPTSAFEHVALADIRADADPWLASAVNDATAPRPDFELTPKRVEPSVDTTLVPATIELTNVAPAAYVDRDSLTPTDLPAGLGSFALELELPQEEAPPENPYLQREAPNRLDIVKRRGGSEETERAVAQALRWLARHQDSDGHWDIRVYDKRCGGCDETKAIHANVALTGLATLCFLGAGHTHEADGPYRGNVARAIDWLLEQQASNGDLRGQETMYTQGIASIALSEALAMTDDERLKEPVELALRFVHASRNRREGGWRYDPGQPGDTSVLGWMMMAMKSASLSGVHVPRDAFEAGGNWLEQVSHPRRPGQYAYRPEREVSPSMTAEGMFIQQLLGHSAAEPLMQASADYIIQHLHDWEEDPNTYFWYYASLALFQHQGDAWETWNNALKRELVEHQRRDGRATGSWDPQGNEWSMLGGRVYQTALCTLMLEVYYRYLPMYAVEEPELPVRPDNAVGTIAGVVRDAETDRPLVGATVRLDVPDGEPILATTDRDGFYYLWAPELPPFFALSASRSGYTPDSVNVDSRTLKSSTLDVDFELEPARGQVVVTEAIPEVHHLGDNRFDGRINSQFQKQSEGAEYGSEFTMTERQLAGRIRQAEVRLLAKGVQRRHSVFINGTLLDHYLDDAPDDGSFGEFIIRFEPELLRVGINTIDIVAKPSSSDIDDFEFVNVQIQLNP